MATLVEYFKRQSNKGNWSFSDQMCGPDGTPLWTTSANGIAAALIAVDRRGSIGFQVSSTDGTDQLTLSANGIVNVNVPPTTLNAVTEGLYDVHVTVWSDDFTVNRVYGRLPIYEGFSPVTTSTTGGSTVGPKVKVWQLKIALVNAGVFDTVDTVVSPTTHDPANIVWTSGGDTTLGDAFSLVVQDALGWTDNQMATLYSAASAILAI